MAYVSQDDKKKLVPEIKSVLKKYGIKGTIRVRHHSTLIVTLRSGVLDLIADYDIKEKERVERLPDWVDFKPSTYAQINVYWVEEWTQDETIKAFYKELIEALKGEDWFDDSDLQTDYHHCSHYISINVGNWDKPYICNAVSVAV